MRVILTEEVTIDLKPDVKMTISVQSMKNISNINIFPLVW